MAEEEPLGAPVVVTEDGAAGPSGSGAAGPSHGADHKQEEEPATEDREEGASAVKQVAEQHTDRGGRGGGGGGGGGDEEEEGKERRDGRSRGGAEGGGRTLGVMETTGGPPGGVTEDGETDRLNPPVEDEDEEDPMKACRLTPDFSDLPDFPESLYELLCTLQEGRRLNDQRCSFSLEAIGVPRRRCHSEPNTNKPAHRVVFSSMTSLQKEEFFELVATAQARRLDDQRARLGRSPPPAKRKTRSFRGSIKQLSFVRRPAAVVPVPVPKEDLYNMILTTQAQGRLEDQRSRAPGPMDDEDFFSLLLKVQGGRMEEQRTELPCMVQT